METYNISEESPVTMYINGEKFVTLMCTPENLKELAVGHMINSGTVKALNDFLTIGACEDMKEIYIQAQNVNMDGNQLKIILGTGCGSGQDIKDKLDILPKVESDYNISLGLIRKAFIRMYKEAVKYHEHGGIHASSLLSNGVFITREDVARHNSHDKVTGYGVLNDVDFKKSVLITTGRISADMVYKAVNTEIPIICSRSNPTTLAVDIAEKCNITIVGRVMSKDMRVFTHKYRIVEEC